jgi:hypothetical protein
VHRADTGIKIAAIVRFLRKRYRLKASVHLILFAALLAGCSSTRTLTMISRNDVEVGYPPTQQHVTGEDCVYNFLGIPASDYNNPSVRRAVDSAAAMAPGSYAMTDMTINRDTLITLAFNRACLRVIGNPVAQTTGNRYLDGIGRDFSWND